MEDINREKSIASLLVSFFANIWINPFKLMEDIANNKRYIASATVLLIAFLLFFGNMFYAPEPEGTSPFRRSTTGEEILRMTGMGSNFASPYMSFMQMPQPGIEEISIVLGMTAALVFLPLLALIFISTLVMNIMVEEVKFKEVARTLSVPYSITLIYTTIFSIIARPIAILEPSSTATGIGILMIIALLGFLMTFLSIYVYALYVGTLSKTYEVKPAAALGPIVVSAIVITLFTFPLSMMMGFL